MEEVEASRRNLLKASLVAASASALASPLASAVTPEGAAGAIKVAGYNNDRVRPIMEGLVGLEQAPVSFHYEDIYAVNRHTFAGDQPYEVTEIGLVPFITRYINTGFRDYMLLPIFISRIFRHRNIFVHADSGIEKPEDLRGKRVGTPGYGMSANTWIRGFLKDQHGVEADDFQWIESAESSDGKSLNSSFAKYYFDDDFPLTKGPAGVDESDLLITGQCDALITAITPKAFLEGNPKIRRLYPNVKQAEQQYFRDTGLFPIMHAVAIRSDVAKAKPWLPMAVYEMYERAKQITYADLETTTTLKVSLPWATQEFEETRELMGADYWPYGIERNRKELELVMRYVHEQGLVEREEDFAALFHPSTLDT